MIIFGTIGACCVGCGFPINFLIFGDVLDKFIGRGAMNYMKQSNIQATSMPQLGGIVSGKNTTALKIEPIVFDLTKWFLVLAACLFVAAFIQMVFWQYSALRQVIRIRQLLFASMLHQDVSWHDQHATGDLVTRLSEQVGAFEF